MSVIGGSIGPALIPTFVRVRETRGIKAAEKLYIGVAFWSLGLLFLATAAMVLAAPLYLPLLASGFSPEKLALTKSLLFAMAPLILFSGLAAVSSAILNASESFAPSGPLSLLPALGAALGACTSGGARGAFAMAIGLVVGHLVEGLVLIGCLARAGFRLQLARPEMDADSRHVLGQYFPMVAGALLMVSTQVVDQSMAAMLPAGSVAALSYGNRMMAVPLNVAATALGTAIIPYLSLLVKRRDWTGIENTVKKYVRLSFAAALLPTAVLSLCAPVLVRLLFERGAFTADDTRTVAGVQTLASLQLPFYLASIVVVRAISSFSSNRLLMYGAVVNCTLNIGLNYFFMRRLGVAGIALSTSVMYLVSFGYLYASYSRRLARPRASSAG